MLTYFLMICHHSNTYVEEVQRINKSDIITTKAIIERKKKH